MSHLRHDSFRLVMYRYVLETNNKISFFLTPRILRIFLKNNKLLLPSVVIDEEKDDEFDSPSRNIFARSYTLLSFWRNCNLYGFSCNTAEKDEKGEVEYVDVSHSNVLFHQDNPKFVLNRRECFLRKKVKIQRAKVHALLTEVLECEEYYDCYSTGSHRIIHLKLHQGMWCVAPLLRTGVVVRWKTFKMWCKDLHVRVDECEKIADDIFRISLRR